MKEVEAELTQASELLEQMALEVRSLPAAERSRLNTTLKGYKADLAASRGALHEASPRKSFRVVLRSQRVWWHVFSRCQIDYWATLWLQTRPWHSTCSPRRARDSFSPLTPH